MRALILAAGTGCRMGGGSARPPKCLTRFAGKTLLQRHLEILRDAGIDDIWLGVGYRAAMIAEELSALGAAGTVRTVFNPDYEEGNIVTLWTLTGALQAGEDVLLMDADVLYDLRLMRRLVDSSHRTCFLLDRDFEGGEEPVKLCVRGLRLVEFGKQIDPRARFDVQGESVGFFRLAAGDAARLAEVAADYVASGRREAYYEDALRDLMLSEAGAHWGYEDITGLPWIEIDFNADVERARRDVLPRLLDARGARAPA